MALTKEEELEQKAALETAKATEKELREKGLIGPSAKAEKPAVLYGPPKIQTAEDAREAFLREEISLDEFNRIRGRFGDLGAVLWVSPNRLEKPDAAFKRDLPKDMYTEPFVEQLSVDQKLDAVEAKEELREDALKLHKKDTTKEVVVGKDTVVFK